MPFVDTPGARIHYTVDGSGPPVLLLQGVGLPCSGWLPQIEGLRGRFQLVAVDNRGIGRSEAEAGRLAIEDMAADALAVMDAIGAPRFHVAGHSMGGLIAQQLALTASSRVASLALLCTFANGRQGSTMTPAFLFTAMRMQIGTLAMRRNAFLELVMPASYLASADRAALAERLRPIFGRDLGRQPPVAMKQLRAMSRFDASARLSALARIPTLVVSAAGDRIALPAYGRELSTLIPGARFVVIENAAHGVTIQRDADVNALLAEHFTTPGVSCPAEVVSP